MNLCYFFFILWKTSYIAYISNSILPRVNQSIYKTSARVCNGLNDSSNSANFAESLHGESLCGEKPENLDVPPWIVPSLPKRESIWKKYIANEEKWYV